MLTKVRQTEVMAVPPVLQKILDPVLMIVEREAHLCTARYGELLESGLPADAAEFIAQDDMAFQLAKAASAAL